MNADDMPYAPTARGDRWWCERQAAEYWEKHRAHPAPMWKAMAERYERLADALAFRLQHLKATETEPPLRVAHDGKHTVFDVIKPAEPNETEVEADGDRAAAHLESVSLPKRDGDGVRPSGGADAGISGA